MKVTVSAKKMSEGQMHKISLVRHAANRQPFRILKAEPVPEALGGLADRVTRLFKSDEAPKVTALFVQKDALTKLLPTLREAGFAAGPDNAELMDGVVVLKQEDYDPDGDGSLLTISPDLAVGFNTVIKGLATWETSSDFNETLQSHSFFPSIRMATEALMDTLWRVNDESDDHAAMQAGVGTALDAFSQHVKGLVSALPVSVIKMERSLASQFEGSTVAPDEKAVAAKTEGKTTMKTENLREAVAGDLAGLFDDETGTETVAKAECETAAPAAEVAETASVEKTDEAATGDEGKKDEATVTADDGTEGKADETVTKADEPATGETAAPEGAAPAPELTLQSLAVAMKSAFEKLDETLTTLSTDQKSALETVNKRLEEVEKSSKETLAKAETAIQKAENTVVTGDVGGPDPLMGTLHTRSTQTRVSKSGASQGAGDVFSGLLPDLDALHQ